MSQLWRVAAITTLCLVGAMTLSAQDQARATARQSGSSRLEMDLGFVLEQSEKTREVGMLQELRSGDRFHVRIRPKQPSYAYLFVARAGAFNLVLPGERSGSRTAQVARDQWNTLPDQDWLRFDDKERGAERMYLFVSTSPVDEIEELFEEGRKGDAVDETWLLDLRNKLDGEGTTTVTRAADVVRVAHRRRGTGAAVVIEELNVRHK